MKRIAAIFAAVVAIGVVPSVASAGNGSTVQVKAQAKAQVTAQIKPRQKVQRFSAAVSVQRVSPRAQVIVFRLALLHFL